MVLLPALIIDGPVGRHRRQGLVPGRPGARSEGGLSMRSEWMDDRRSIQERCQRGLKLGHYLTPSRGFGPGLIRRTTTCRTPILPCRAAEYNKPENSTRTFVKGTVFTWTPPAHKPRGLPCHSHDRPIDTPGDICASRSNAIQCNRY